MISGLLTILFSLIGVFCWFIAFFTFALSGMSHGLKRQDKIVVFCAFILGSLFFQFARLAWVKL